MTRATFVALLALCACEDPAPGQKADSDTETPTPTDTAWEGSVARGIPCGMLLDCFYSCGDDGGCQDECYGASDPGAQELVDELEACWDDHGCGNDASCGEANCGGELAACREQPLPQGGAVCSAAGIYEVCQGGSCTAYDVVDGAWGYDEAAAQAWGLFYCELAMNERLLLASLNASSVGVVESCEVTSCEAH